MLKLFRRKTVAKIVLWSLLILIMPAFVLWGVGNIGRSREKGPKYVGKIIGKKVTFDDFAASMTATRCQILLNYMGNREVLDMFFKNKALLGRTAWDRIILLREAHDKKIYATDKEVVDYIKNHPLFQRNGKFDDKIYGYALRYSIGIDPRGFEEIVRENLAIKKLNDLLTKDAALTDDEIRESYRRHSAKFKISYIMFPAVDFKDKVKLTDDEVKAYYENRKADFILPPLSKDAGQGPRQASYEDVKDAIRSMLAEERSMPLAIKHASEEANKISVLMKTGNLKFKDAAAKMGLKTADSNFFSRAEYLDGIGEAAPLADEASKMRLEDVAGPIQTAKGPIVFALTGVQNFDEEKFKKDKDDFAKKALIEKKDRLLEQRLTDLEKKATLNINLAEYDKYYK